MGNWACAPEIQLLQQRRLYLASSARARGPAMLKGDGTRPQDHTSLDVAESSLSHPQPGSYTQQGPLGPWVSEGYITKLSWQLLKACLSDSQQQHPGESLISSVSLHPFWCLALVTSWSVQQFLNFFFFSCIPPYQGVLLHLYQVWLQSAGLGLIIWKAHTGNVITGKRRWPGS